MKRLTIGRILTAGTAAGAVLLAAQAIAVAQERGSIQGVINDAYGKPVAGAFVKLKNDERRLTFMVVSREQGQFEAKDLPPGQYRVQGVAGGNPERLVRQSERRGGRQDAKVGLALDQQRGPMLAPAWPQRIPEAAGRKASRRRTCRQATARSWSPRSATPATTCSASSSSAPNRDHWAHTVARMRTRMTVANDPRSHRRGRRPRSSNYLVANSRRSSPTTPTAGCRARC